MKKLITILAVILSLNSYSQSVTGKYKIPDYLITEFKIDSDLSIRDALIDIFAEADKRVTAYIPFNNLDTVSVTLTIRSQDWAWAIGKFGAGSDSVSRARIRQIRTAIIAANPPLWTTNVTINNVPGQVVMTIYNIFVYAHFGEIIPMGNNTAERTTIYTNIRAINNSALQYFIGLRDGELSSQFIQTRSSGKAILIDN